MNVSISISGKPTQWIGEPEKGESLVAVPDALFKTIVSPIGIFEYVYPQEHVDYGNKDHKQFQTTVDYIELVTGLEFNLKAR